MVQQTIFSTLSTVILIGRALHCQLQKQGGKPAVRQAAPARASATEEAPHRVCTAAPFPGLARLHIRLGGGLRGIERWPQRRGGCPQPRFTLPVGLA